MRESFDEWVSSMVIMTAVLIAEMPSDVVSMNDSSEISAAHLVTDRGHPSGAGSWYGRRSQDASCFVFYPEP